ncbi:MAG: hypothetical protein JNN15_14530 [Blastocatellia bacterium]|nr:hypothetical protein [Blastocatellia bacterium]
MREISSFSLQNIEPKNSPLGQKIYAHQSRIIFKGIPTELIVEGVCFEAEYECRLGYLLLIGDNCPYEEGLNIYLLSHQLKIIDVLRLGCIYTPAIFRSAKIINNNSIEFEFFGEDLWQLTLLDKPKRNWSLPVGEMAMFYSLACRPFKYSIRANYLQLTGKWKDNKGKEHSYSI